jgi:UDP-glucose:(heptosyl)LPS alpha-1,3-glucosyltransferase
MRIALLARGYHKMGGISRVVADLSEGLAARGQEVTVFCAEPPVSPPLGIAFVPVRVPRAPYALRVPLFAHRASRRAAGGGFDVVHGQATDCHGADLVSAHSCHRYAIEMKRREGDLRDRLKKRLHPVHPLVFALERFNFSPRGSRLIHAVSARVASEIVATYGVAPERIRVIPNGVDLALFHPENRARERRAARARLRLGEEPVLLFVGYELYWKGLGTLCEALARMRRTDARVLVAGRTVTPYLRAVIARLGLASRVRFAGPVAAVETCYAASDLFVLPTRYEAFGLVIAEAMASGLPVVTTRVAGAAEWMEDGVSGLLLDVPPDPALLAARLDALLDDAPLRARLAREGRRVAEAHWGLDSITDRVLELYRELAS